MLNKVILIGNLTRDIELRYTPNGTAVANTGIAVNNRYITKEGEKKEETCFVDLTFFGKSAETANRFLQKGSKVAIDGKLVFQSWIEKEGIKRSKHTITVLSMEMLNSKNNKNESVKKEGLYGQPEEKQVKTPVPEIDINEDEIPF